MQREYPSIPFERYADDAICHCASEAQALELRQALEQRFAACRLRLHPEKTKIVYCKDANRLGEYPERSFDFLGYTFRSRSAIGRNRKRASADRRASPRPYLRARGAEMPRATHLHQGVWLGDRGAPAHRWMALFLQRGTAASGAGLPDAAYGFRRRSL
jgi:Reverse transcriptase (RNA-dependent DNA polymerase)